MASQNKFQEIFKQLGKPLRLAGNEAPAISNNTDDEKKIALFEILYHAQEIAADLGWGDELEWEEVSE
jgi:hypothetical protein